MLKLEIFIKSLHKIYKIRNKKNFNVISQRLKFSILLNLGAITSLNKICFYISRNVIIILMCKNKLYLPNYI